MTRSRPTAGLLAVAALAVGLLGGCGNDESGPRDEISTGSNPTSSTTADTVWRPATKPLDTGGLVWATGSTVHLADGTRIETATDIREYTVAGDGIYFTPESTSDATSGETSGETSGSTGEEDEGALIGSGPLFEALPDGSVRQVAESATNPTASPDGRYLVFLDNLGSDLRDRFGTVQVQTVIVDTETGEEVARSSEGMGRTSSDDLADLYEDSGIGIIAVTDDTAYVDAVGEFAFTLDTGDVEEVSDGEDVRRLDDSTSPGGTWTFTATEQRQDPITPTTGGQRVVPQTGTPRWSFDHWIDDTHVVGFAYSGPGRGYQLTRRNHTDLMVCTVPSGRCHVVPGTRDRSITFPSDNLY